MSEDQGNKSICEERLYERLFKTHAEQIRNFLYSKFGGMDLAEDLLQEAFVKLWENCDKVSPENAKSYVYKVAINLGISDKRHEQVKFKHQDLIVKEYGISTNESPEFLMLENEFMEKYKKTIASLPERQREVFLLSRVEKKKYKEIAELSGVSVKAIEKLMHKALIKVPDYKKYLKIKEASNNLSFSNYDQDKSFSSLKSRLDNSKKTKKTKVVSLYSWITAVAACAAIVVGFLFFTQSNTTSYASPIAQNSTISLPDGSTMILNATAEAKVDTENWEENREVFLEGEAFFKVKKGSKFTVNTSLGNVQVLGTQFTVNTVDNDLLTVKCFEGKVKVTTEEGKETFLTKGMGYQLNDTNINSWDFVNKSPSWYIQQHYTKYLLIRL